MDESDDEENSAHLDQLLQKYIVQTSGVIKRAPSTLPKLDRAATLNDLTSQQLQSMQIQLPILESTQKGKLNLPISKAEKEEFNFGFSTRPKVPRTPISSI
jgi:hypothetical protein